MYFRLSISYEKRDLQNVTSPKKLLVMDPNWPPLCDLQLYKEIEICPKVTRNIHIEKSDSTAGNYGRFVCLCSWVLVFEHFLCKQNVHTFTIQNQASGACFKLHL